MRRVTDFIQGLISLAFTSLLLVGVPAFLVTRFGFSAFTDAVDVVTDELASQATITETLLLAGLLLVAWLAWAMIATSIITEAIALVRGKAAWRLPVPAGLQHAAARLVASCALVVSSFTASVPAAAIPIVPLAGLDAAAPASVLVVDDVTSFQAAPPGVSSAESPATAALEDGPQYVVQHGDTWWSLAERLLGDGLRWNDLLTVNEGNVMSDGTVITPAVQTPRAGWQLSLPDDAVLPLATTATPSVAAPAVTAAASDDLIRVGDTDETWTVEKGDHFWKIADEALTEAWGRAPTDAEIHPFWRDVIELNRDRLLPPEDEDMIYPAQTFLLPEIPGNPQAAPGDDPVDIAVEVPTDTEPEPASESEPETSSEAAPETPDVTIETPASPEVEAPEVDEPVVAAPQPPVTAPAPAGETNESADAVVPDLPSAIPVPNRPPAPAVPVPAAETPAPDLDATADSEADEREEADTSGGLTDFAIPALIVSGIGLLAAGLLSAVNRIRNRRIGEREPGKAPKFKPPEGVEAELQRSADADGLVDVDRVMRYLGSELAGLDTQPGIVGLSVEAERIIVLLDAPHPNPPSPFAASGNQWVISRDEEIPSPPPRAVAPLPTLVTIGHTSRSQLLLDLEHATVVNLTGTRSDIEATMATMVVELAASPLADQLEIVCVGFGHELAAFDRVTIVDTLDEVEHRIRAHADDVAEVATDELTAAEGRINDIAGDTWTPLVVFAPDAQPDSQLLASARQTSSAGVTALVTADGAATWQLHVAGNQVQIPHINVSLRRTNLTAAQRADACALLEDARNPETIEVVDLVEQIHEAPPVPINGQRQPAAVDLWDPTDAGEGDPPARAWDSPAPPAPPLPPHPKHDVDYQVEILGAVRVTDRSGTELHFERSAAAQLLAYLVQHPNGVTIDSAMEALYPNQEPSKSRMYNLASCARKTLGESATGEAYVPRAVDGMLSLSERVGSDYEHFRALVRYAGKCEPQMAVDVLREALELVRGEPFTGRGLDWAFVSGAYTEVALAVDEAARAMAALALDELDSPEDAVWATQQGLAVSPRSTELHLLRLRAALARDDALEPDAVYQQYMSMMEAEDDLPEGGSLLDQRIVGLYESWLRSKPTRWAEAGTGT